jgi:hypothetical protein
MHLPAFPPSAAGRLAPQLAGDGLQGDAFRDGVAHRPVGAENDIVNSEIRANASRDGFLPLALVQGSGNQTLKEKLVQPIFKHTDQDHLPVHLQHSLLG